jgi:hypothetical protein
LFLQEKNDLSVSATSWFCESVDRRRCAAQIGYVLGAVLSI